MPENDPLADVFTLFAAPIAGTIRSVEQFRTGVDEFLKGVENFNRTMANLNETTERINSLLADVEEPIRAAVPQLTRSVKAADEMMKVVSGPAIAAAPAFNQIAETIATPAFQQLPDRVNQFNEMMAEMSRRLGPLAQLAESAGGLFGGLRLPGMPGAAPAARYADVISVENDDDLDDDLDDDSDATDGDEPDEGDELDEGDEPDEWAAPVGAKRKSPKKAAPRKKPAAKRRTAKKTAAKKKPAKKKAAAKPKPEDTSSTEPAPSTDDYL